MAFRFKQHVAADPDTPLEFGLIAEEVAEVFPELVVYDEEGRPETVKYHLLAPLLLRELQRAERELGATRDAAEIASGRGLRAARLRAIKGDIASNLGGDLSATALAVRQRVTPRYIHKLFESEGTTLSRFILGQRLACVHRMLTDPRCAGSTISAIVYKAGFGDLSTFNREFRRHYGKTPSEVRTASQLEQRFLNSARLTPRLR